MGTSSGHPQSTSQAQRSVGNVLARCKAMFPLDTWLLSRVEADSGSILMTNKEGGFSKRIRSEKCEPGGSVFSDPKWLNSQRPLTLWPEIALMM